MVSFCFGCTWFRFWLVPRHSYICSSSWNSFYLFPVSISNVVMIQSMLLLTREVIAPLHLGRLFFKPSTFLLPVTVPPVLHNHPTWGCSIRGHGPPTHTLNPSSGIPRNFLCFTLYIPNIFQGSCTTVLCNWCSFQKVAAPYRILYYGLHYWSVHAAFRAA